MFDINPAVYRALEEVAVQVHDQIIEAIESDDWPYQRNGEAVTTIRKNKDVVTSPRDIVDLGTLRNSQAWEPVDYGDGLGIRFYNTAEHSDLVHEGGHNGNAEIPARPFMTRVLAELNIEQMLADELKSNIEMTKTGKIRTRDPQTGRFTYSRGLGDVNVETDTNNFGGGNGDNP
jgi:hypothetical protein